MSSIGIPKETLNTLKIFKTRTTYFPKMINDIKLQIQKPNSTKAELKKSHQGTL